MCHGSYKTGKTIKFKPEKSKHVNAKPYKREKSKKRDFEEEN